MLVLMVLVMLAFVSINYQIFDNCSIICSNIQALYLGCDIISKQIAGAILLCADSDSDTKTFICPKLLDRFTSSFSMIWPIMSPSLCKNLVAIGLVVSEI